MSDQVSDNDNTRLEKISETPHKNKVIGVQTRHALIRFISQWIHNIFAIIKQ